jgi:hypothetical protein
VAPSIKALVAIAAIELWLALLFPLDWTYGLARGAIVLVLLCGLILLRLWPRPATQPAAAQTDTVLAAFLKLAVAAALILNAVIAVQAVGRCLEKNEIEMDQGPALWIAARLLWKGENPYGLGALVDLRAYEGRTGQRDAEGIVVSIPAKHIEEALARYGRTLDPELRNQLLPTATAGKNLLSEARLLGYKYSPLLIDIAALFAPLGQPAAIVVLQIAMYAITMLAMACLFWGAFQDKNLAMAGILALLLDRHLTWEYVELAMADIWVLAFCALSVLAFQRSRPLAMGACLGAAFGCKIFPSLIFMPLLLACGGIWPIGVAAGVAAAIYLPWFAWDPAGLLANVFLWPFVMFKDTTSWTYYAPHQVVLAARLIAFGALVLLWFRYLTGRETRLFWTLAVASTLLLMTGNTFHNNYIPWALIWIVAAAVERYSTAPVPWPLHAGTGPLAFERQRSG